MNRVGRVEQGVYAFLSSPRSRSSDYATHPHKI